MKSEVSEPRSPSRNPPGGKSSVLRPRVIPHVMLHNNEIGELANSARQRRAHEKKTWEQEGAPIFFNLNLVGWNVNGLRLKQSNISITLAMDIHWFIGQCECIFSFVSTWKMLAV